MSPSIPTGPEANIQTEGIVSVRGIHKRYGDAEVLRGVDLEVARQETLVVIGPSGGGKSTMLRCIAGLEHIDSGAIEIDGVVVQDGAKQSRERRRAARPLQREVGLIFQQFNLFPHKTALENVALPLRLVRRVPGAAAREAALSELHRVGLEDHASKYPDQLSGGQQQRVAIARAMAMRPKVLLFDEPTSALDPELVGGVLAIMRQLADSGMTMIVVTHEMSFARDAADAMVFIDGGVIVEQGKPKQMLDSPEKDRTRTFLGHLGPG